MKQKTTRKYLWSNFGHIISIGYCNIQTLLRGWDPDYYLTRAEGWAADVYVFSGNIAIVTGYDPIGNIKPFYELQETYENKAREAVNNCPYDPDNGGWDNLEFEIEKLRDEFVFLCVIYGKLGRRKFDIVKDNLLAFVHNFGFPTIETGDAGSGYYVRLAGDLSYIQYCENIDYLNGWLFGVVQGVNRGEFKRGVKYNNDF